MGFFKNLFQSKSQKEKARKYKVGMNKTSSGVVSQLKDLIDEQEELDVSIFDDIEELFIMADMGVETVINFVDYLRDEVNFDKIKTSEDLKEFIVDEMFKYYVKDEVVVSNLDIQKNRLNVVLFVGVNGVGKTTTIGKVAHEYIKKGYKVMMVAGDTFRAGAIEQLERWASKVGADFYQKEAGSDPSSVMFDAIKDAEERIKEGHFNSYEAYGFGFYKLQLKGEDKRSIGTCGLIKRDTLEDVDIGFAFLPEYENKGFGYESSLEVMRLAKEVFKLNKIVAITNPDNEKSIGLLEKLGLTFEKKVKPFEDEKVPNHNFSERRKSFQDY